MVFQKKRFQGIFCNNFGQDGISGVWVDVWASALERPQLGGFEGSFPEGALDFFEVLWTFQISSFLFWRSGGGEGGSPRRQDGGGGRFL